VCSFWGGIISQEIVKLTGKYKPLRQWLHHEFNEVLPSGQVQRAETSARYHDYHILFGDGFMQRMAQSTLFMVGMGALGCEFVKMLAMMGASSAESAMCYCTDDDSIEVSNLNRQFLFRRQHVGRNKCEVGCEAGRAMNPHCNL
jgi:ubiquitin-activating enzyme E1